MDKEFFWGLLLAIPLGILTNFLTPWVKNSYLRKVIFLFVKEDCICEKNIGK